MKKICEKCDKIVEPVLENFNSQFEVKDKVYKYRAYRGYCPECNSIIEKLPNQDIESRDKAFRKAEGIITTEQIQEILEKYKVDSKNLANMLNWSVSKMENYIQGDIPSKEDSAILLNVLENEDYAKSLLL